MTIFEYDHNQYCDLLCGVDEAGRGPLAGDVYAAAVILPMDCQIDGLNDSKKLTAKKRVLLYDEIVEKALSFCVATATIEEIEEVNILNATYLAMRRAVSGLNIVPSMVLVDGNRDPHLDLPTKCIVKGDGTSASIAAASILAKVSRDRYMERIAEQYPQYEFERHKGYGTALHYQKLDEFGESPVHRHSFLKKYYLQKEEPKPEESSSKKLGNAGEALTCKYLEKKGCTILECNYFSKYGEIDIIAQQGDLILFVEVKARHDDTKYDAKSAVTKIKQRKIMKTASSYQQQHRNGLQPRFDVAEVYFTEDRKVYINYISAAFEELS